jgi:hypothetical protein
MTLAGGIATILYYLVGLAGALAWAASLGATMLIGLVLWTSFFGFSMVTFLLLFWSREHWLG